MKIPVTYKNIHIQIKTIIKLLVCLSLSSVVIAEEEHWEFKFSAAVKLQQEGKYEDARKKAEEYVLIAELRHGADDSSVVSGLILIGDIYSDQKLYVNAEPFFSRAVAINEKLYGVDSPTLEDSLMYLAGNHIGKGEFEQAEKIYLRLLAIKEKSSGVKHTNLVTPLRAIATLYRLEGRTAESEAIVNRTLELWQTSSASTFGVNFSDIGTAHELQNLAALRVDTGNLTEAYKLYLQALKLLDNDLKASRKKWGTPGNGTLGRVVDCLDQLSTLSGMLKMKGTAQKYKARAAVLREEMGGEAADLPKTWGQSVFNIALPVIKAEKN